MGDAYACDAGPVHGSHLTGSNLNHLTVHQRTDSSYRSTEHINGTADLSQPNTLLQDVGIEDSIVGAIPGPVIAHTDDVVQIHSQDGDLGDALRQNDSMNNGTTDLNKAWRNNIKVPNGLRTRSEPQGSDRSQSKGHAIFIRSQCLDESPLQRRKQKESDADILEQYFRHCNFTVTSCPTNARSANAMISWLQNEAQNIARHKVSFVVVVLSHGYPNWLCAPDGSSIHIQQDIIRCFESENCPSLSGKLKLFIALTCKSTLFKCPPPPFPGYAKPTINQELHDLMSHPIPPLEMKLLRSWIVQAYIAVYNLPIDSKKKNRAVKQMWNHRYPDWPDSVPFGDPNNRDRAKNRLPKLALQQMFSYLAMRYHMLFIQHRGWHTNHAYRQSDTVDTGTVKESLKSVHETDDADDTIDSGNISCPQLPAMQSLHDNANIVDEDLYSGVGSSSPSKDHNTPTPYPGRNSSPLAGSGRQSMSSDDDIYSAADSMNHDAGVSSSSAGREDNTATHHSDRNIPPRGYVGQCSMSSDDDIYSAADVKNDDADPSATNSHPEESCSYKRDCSSSTSLRMQSAVPNAWFSANSESDPARYDSPVTAKVAVIEPDSGNSGIIYKSHDLSETVDSSFAAQPDPALSQVHSSDISKVPQTEAEHPPVNDVVNGGTSSESSANQSLSDSGKSHKNDDSSCSNPAQYTVISQSDMSRLSPVKDTVVSTLPSPIRDPKVEKERKQKKEFEDLTIELKHLQESNKETLSRIRVKEQELSKLETRKDDLSEKWTCKVCLTNTVNRVFLPCRHLVCCQECAPKLKSCPMCREAIRSIIHVTVGTNEVIRRRRPPAPTIPLPQSKSLPEKLEDRG